MDNQEQSNKSEEKNIIDDIKQRIDECIKQSWYHELLDYVTDNTKETQKFMVGRILLSKQIIDHQVKKNYKEIVTFKELEYKKLTIDDFKARDSVGASIIHLAYLYKRFEVGRELVKSAIAFDENGENAVAPYTFCRDRKDKFGEYEDFHPYTGENILHIAIAHVDYQEVVHNIYIYNL